jgi:hypothetical protein
MEPSRFDDLARSLVFLSSRRGLIKAGLAIAASGLLHLTASRGSGFSHPGMALARSVPGVIECDGMLVNSQSDSDYCGDCDTRCPGTHHCVQGRCQPDVRTAVADDGCNSRYLRLWFSGFIPQEIPNITSFSPLADGATITKPLFSSAEHDEGDRCFVTNGRRYSSDSRENSLFHSAIEIDLLDMSIVSEDHRGDPVSLVDCGTGEALCSQRVATSAMSFSTPWSSQLDQTFSVDWSANPGLPCIDGGPTLDYAVRVVVQRASSQGAVRVQASGTRPAFPAFEIYAALESGVPTTLLQRGPDAGSAFGDLYLEPTCILEPLESQLLCGCGQCEPGRSCQVENDLQVCDDLRSFHLLTALPDPVDASAGAQIVADGLFTVTVHEAPVFTNSSNGIDRDVPVRTVGFVAAEGDMLRVTLDTPGVAAAFGSSLWLHRLIDGRSVKLYDPAAPPPPEETLRIAQPIAFGQVRDWAGAVVCCELPEVEPQVCADAWNDRVHCGNCGHACTSDEYCHQGQCHCLPPKSSCGETCVDLLIDPLHCGTCDTACEAGNGLCEAGTCRP